VFSHDVTAQINFIRRHVGGVKFQHGGQRFELNVNSEAEKVIIHEIPLTEHAK
jgi:hypothetical protein